ncbi:MAG TPA: lactonase family protein [Candidatus Acidoferrum sp.]
MSLARRLLAALLVFTAFVLSTPAQEKAKPPAPKRYLGYIGTYTEKTKSKGIYSFRLEDPSGKLSLIGVAAESQNPSFLALHPSGKYLYAVNETSKFGDEESGAVSAFSIDRKTGKLTLLNQVASRGAGPCHVSLDKTGHYVLVANYDGGTVAVFPVKDDGQLGKYTGFAKHSGQGPNKERQEGPHAHWIATSPDDQFLLAADLGIDRILVSKFHLPDGAFTTSKLNPGAKLKAGAGPRHAAFSPNGKFLYVASELNSTVTAFSYNAKDGTLHELQALSTLPKDFSGANDVAEIAVHPSGKFLYVSNRGRDSLAVFSIDPRKGTLKPVADIATQGKTPRNFAIDPSRKFLLAANQESNTIVVFNIDPLTGVLTLTGQVAEVPSPVCIVFLPVE